MGRSTTWFIKARTIAGQEELAAVLIRLMLSINDLSLANAAIEDWNSTTQQTRERRKRGALMYFTRVLLGHVHEALEIVRDISKSPTLRAAVDRCDKATTSSYGKLEAFVNSSEVAPLNRLRNRAAFHYDKQLPLRSLAQIATQASDHSWSCSMGTHSLDWHFELADAVMDRMVIREVFELREPRSPERHEKTKMMALRQQEIAREFTDFAAHFVRHYSTRR